MRSTVSASDRCAGPAIRIRGGSGLGDSLYVQAVARHLVGRGQKVEVCVNYPDVFAPLLATGRCVTSAFRRRDIDVLAHYSWRRAVRETDQFRDCCIQAGFGDECVTLRLDWALRNDEMTGALRRRAGDRPIVVVQLPRQPMARSDGFGKELLPDCRVIQRAIDQIGRDAFIVQIGQGAPLYHFDGIDCDLVDRTDVADMIDVVSIADGCLGYVSFMVPLSESLNRPALMVWSRRGLNSGNALIRRLTPGKVIHRPDLVKTVVDDCSEQELVRAVDALLAEVRGPALV